MTSPAAPESETPLKLWLCHRNGIMVESEKFGEYVRLSDYQALERRLSLAQTEIKGHMRIEDDLKRDLAMETQNVNAQIERHQRIYAEQQARIAELEKIVKFLLGEEALLGFWFGERPAGQPQFWWRKHLREALKDRP